MFRRFVTRCTSVYVLSIHTLCSHSLNEYTTVLEVWDFPFLLPHNPPPPSSSLLHPPSRAMKVSRVGSYSTPPHPYTGGEGCGIEPRRLPNGTCASRKREATTPQQPPTSSRSITTGGSHRHSTAKSFTTQPTRWCLDLVRQAWRLGSTHRSNHHNAPAHSLTPLMLVSPACSPRPHHPSLALCFIISSPPLFNTPAHAQIRAIDLPPR